MERKTNQMIMVSKIYTQDKSISLRPGNLGPWSEDFE